MTWTTAPLFGSEEVRAIRREAAGNTYEAVAANHRCSVYTVAKIARRERYANVSDYSPWSTEDPWDLGLYVPSLEYLAALIDGEGCISCYRNFKRACQIRLTISQKYNLNILRRVHEKYGGRLYTRTEKSAWVINGRHAQELLGWVQPYLIGKSLQAEIAKALQGKPYDHPKVVFWRHQLSNLKRQVLL